MITHVKPDDADLVDEKRKVSADDSRVSFGRRAAAPSPASSVRSAPPAALDPATRSKAPWTSVLESAMEEDGGYEGDREEPVAVNHKNTNMYFSLIIVHSIDFDVCILHFVSTTFTTFCCLSCHLLTLFSYLSPLYTSAGNEK